MKIISQETFDQVVLENVTEFDNTLDEAVEEATKEFEAQGVQLGNIVRNMKINEDKTKVIHAILESLNVIDRSVGHQASQSELISSLKTFTCQCKLSLAHRVLATKNDAYKIILSCIKNAKENDDNEVLNNSLQAMGFLSDTNPDILTSEGSDLLVALLDIWQSRLDDSEIPLYLANWSLQCCLKHEGNRQALVEAGVPRHLKSLLLTHGTDKNIAKTTCKALRAFTLDDDIRTEFGKAHDHARLLVEELDLISTCLELVKEYLMDSDVTSEFLSTLSRLCVRAEYCQAAVDGGALIVINDILVSFLENAQLIRQSINLLKTVSGNDSVKDEVVKIGAAPLIVLALQKHQTSVGVCEAACSAISMLALRVPAHAKQLGSLGACEAVVQAMKIHSQEKQIQKMGCMAVRNLACRIPENIKSLIDCEVENVIQTALENFGTDDGMTDLAKAALRDLNLSVKLEEQWKGTGVQISR